jgi:hypothetical protein
MGFLLRVTGFLMISGFSPSTEIARKHGNSPKPVTDPSRHIVEAM